MRRSFVVIVMLVLTLLGSPAYAQRGRIEQGKLVTAALAGNLLGDTATRPYKVYLPPSYDLSTRRFPTVYVLHGGAATEADMVSLLQPALDSMIRQRKIGEFVAVFVNAANKLNGSWYLNSPVIGDYETYISQDLIREIDGRYRTFTDRENRAITGYSMGGWGALHLGFKFPDVFSVVVSEAALANARGKTADTQERVLAHLHPTNLTQWASVPFPANNFEGLLAGLLPEPNQPSLFTGNPYALANGTLALVDVQAQRCVDEDVQHGDLARYVQQPIRLAALEVVHGTSDSIIPIAEARDFTNALATAGVEFTFQTHTGDHVYLPELALPFLSDHLPGAELYVAPPTVTVVAAPDQLRLTFPTQLGVDYVVESADSFESPAESWTERVRLLGDGKSATITFAAGAPTSFFRVRAQNPSL